MQLPTSLCSGRYYMICTFLLPYPHHSFVLSWWEELLPVYLHPHYPFRQIFWGCLTLKDLFISESCIEIKIKLNFYFHTSLWASSTSTMAIILLDFDSLWIFSSRRVNRISGKKITTIFIQKVNQYGWKKRV